ncbi:hypothetical protein GCM10010353_26010 [Streptomyces chryseus]|nr:hypothetical protein GCM10010353_26010 [Streptomyces chryseus]
MRERVGGCWPGVGCEGGIHTGGGSGSWSGSDGGATPEEGLKACFDIEQPEVPEYGYRVERQERDRVLYSFDVKGRTKVAVVVAKDRPGRPGWGPETSASCDPAELPADYTDTKDYEVRNDEQGNRVPVSKVSSSAGSAHCEWQKAHFEIPNSAARAVRAAGALGASMVTVHSMGGRGIMNAAVTAARDFPRPRVLALTVVTGMTDTDLADIGVTASTTAQVGRLARLAMESGCDGVIASPREAALLRGHLGPDPLIVTPGVVLPGESSGEHARHATPRAAVAGGVSYIVLGRSITRAADPVAAVRLVRSDAAGQKRSREGSAFPGGQRPPRPGGPRGDERQRAPAVLRHRARDAVAASGGTGAPRRDDDLAGVRQVTSEPVAAERHDSPGACRAELSSTWAPRCGVLSSYGRNVLCEARGRPPREAGTQPQVRRSRASSGREGSGAPAGGVGVPPYRCHTVSVVVGDRPRCACRTPGPGHRPVRGARCSGPLRSRTAPSSWTRRWPTRCAVREPPPGVSTCSTRPSRC